MRRGAWQRVGVLALVWSMSALYLVRFVDRGWIPHDEGALAQSAERLLHGDLPHRDFVELYTGGLTYLHALAFRLLGTNLLSLRWLLLACSLAYLPTIYAIARRAGDPAVAALVALVALTWSLPNYFASVPSWYNLFLAGFGVLALFRHIETGARRWLFLAGVCGGLSLLVKVVGVYYIAGAVLFLVYREEVTCESASEHAPGGRALLVTKVLLCLLLTASLALLLRSRATPTAIVHFVVPGTTVAAFLVWSEGQRSRGALGRRFRALLRLLVPFGLGVATPVVLFLIPYYLQGGSLGDLYRGIVVRPQARFRSASFSLAPLATMLPAVPYAWLLCARPSVSRSLERAFAQVLAVALALALVAGGHAAIYGKAWLSARSLAPIVVIAGCIVLARVPLESRQRQELFLLVGMTAMLSLVQFPFAAPIYFCYVAPFVALTVYAVVMAQPGAPRRIHTCVAVFYLVFAVVWLNTGYILWLGVRYAPYHPRSFLALERGGLRVSRSDKLEYERLVRLILRERRGPYIYAAPDCPEVYFLSESRNPTPTLFEFLDTSATAADMLRVLDEHGVNVVALNRRPGFSPRVSPEVAAALAARFPNATTYRRFSVFWK